MTAIEAKFRAEQNAAAKEKFHAGLAHLASGDVPPAPKKAFADPKRFADAQYVRTIRHYTMRPGETIEDILEVRSSDLTFWAQLMVVGSDHIGAHVELQTLVEAKLASADRREFDADGYRIEDTGDVLRRLAVIRTADNKLMRDGFKTRQDATRYITTELVPQRLAS